MHIGKKVFSPLLNSKRDLGFEVRRLSSKNFLNEKVKFLDLIMKLMNQSDLLFFLMSPLSDVLHWLIWTRSIYTSHESLRGYTELWIDMVPVFFIGTTPLLISMGWGSKPHSKRNLSSSRTELELYIPFLHFELVCFLGNARKYNCKFLFVLSLILHDKPIFICLMTQAKDLWPGRWHL